MLTPGETTADLRISRSTMFELQKSGEVPSALLGPQIPRVPRAGLVEHVERALAVKP